MERRTKNRYFFVQAAIYSIPLFVIVSVLYMILFPVENYIYSRRSPEFSKIDIEKNTEQNQFSFGFLPQREFRYTSINAEIASDCPLDKTEVVVEKNYKAFLLENGEPIQDEKQLTEILYEDNKTKFPNGSLLHLKPTNEVFLISKGKKVLFPGPEIFNSFGYSFENLTDVENSDIDQFPDAPQRVFLWSMAHPDGTIFKSFPSGRLYVLHLGKKRPITDPKIFEKAWPEGFFIAATDPESQKALKCGGISTNGNIKCKFDLSELSGLGKYFHFRMIFSNSCRVTDVGAEAVRIKFISDRTVGTIKESLRGIAASVLNRYFFNEQP